LLFGLLLGTGIAIGNHGHVAVGQPEIPHPADYVRRSTADPGRRHA
jgi:hypothetical protein